VAVAVQPRSAASLPSEQCWEDPENLQGHLLAVLPAVAHGSDGRRVQPRMFSLLSDYSFRFSFVLPTHILLSGLNPLNNPCTSCYRERMKI